MTLGFIGTDRVVVFPLSAFAALSFAKSHGVASQSVRVTVGTMCTEDLGSIVVLTVRLAALLPPGRLFFQFETVFKFRCRLSKLASPALKLLSLCLTVAKPFSAAYRKLLFALVVSLPSFLDFWLLKSSFSARYLLESMCCSDTLRCFWAGVLLGKSKRMSLLIAKLSLWC